MSPLTGISAFLVCTGAACGVLALAAAITARAQPYDDAGDVWEARWQRAGFALATTGAAVVVFAMWLDA